MKYVLWAILFVISCNACVSQDTTAPDSKTPRHGNVLLLAKADNAFEQMRYREALNLYMPQLGADGANANLNFKVALCHSYLLNNPKGNIQLLKKAVANFSDKYNFYNTSRIPAGMDAFYFLGKNYLSAGDIDSAIQSFIDYQSLVKNDLPLDAGRQLKMCLNAKKLMRSPRELNIVPLNRPVNSEFDESRPVIALDNSILFFASRRPDKNDGDAQMHDDDIYYSIADDKGGFNAPQPFAYNTAFDEEPVALSANGNTIYFRRTDKRGRGDIFYSEKKDDKWGEPKLVKGINSEADEQGLSVSNDGNMRIVSSNRPGGLGGYDLYVSTRKNGRWSRLKNMGAAVNSDMDEISPFIFPDTKRVYFSSNGNRDYGMGGFDIFFTTPDSSGKKWIAPFTLGYPVNRSDNEKDYVMGSQGLTFYTSVSKNGDLDLFQIVSGEFKPEIQEQITEVVGTSETQTISVVEVEKEKKVNVDKEVEVSKVEEVEKDVDKNVGFVNADEAKKLDKVIAVQKEEVEIQNVVETEKTVYTNKSQQQIDSLNGLDASDKGNGETGDTSIAMKPAQNPGEKPEKESKDERATKVLAQIDKDDREALVNKLKEDIAREMKEKRNAVFKTFYFNFNSDEVELEKYELKVLVDFLKEHKDVNIEVLGHTDNLGSWETNFWISRQRARSVYDYLYNNNIAKSRMIFNGKGAIDPVAENTSAAGRAQNRRVEIILIK